ncbi:hypothetical protein F5I97DRAFT_222513 [Phlebopus sp. FC_14]|nr:hypothetical protein F5I97DRAFT_222513 [Phlebopus sp. FC_14]
MNSPPRRSVLLDHRRWPFFGGRAPPANLSNTMLRDRLVVLDVSGNAGDEEQAGERDVGGIGGSKGKSGSSAVPLPPGSGNEADSQGDSQLVSAWADRLQVLTVVTTFLASMDGQLFSLTDIPTNISLQTSTASQELVFSCLSGALIFHVCASILGYVASFALIRYRIAESSAETDNKDEGAVGSPSDSQQSGNRQPSKRLIVECIHPFQGAVALCQLPKRLLFNGASSRQTPPPPLSLLTRCYYTTLCLTALGFILGLTGILAYAWAGLRMTVGIFSTICLGLSFAAGIWAIFL